MTSQHSFEIVVVGAGAAGLAAAIFAAEAASGNDTSILIIEGAIKPGAKILVSGGGRCNVTNEHVSSADFCGGSRAIIRNVLAQFNDDAVRTWFEGMAVPLKLEPTGKYFPVSDQAKSVLAALIDRINELGIKMWTGTRVTDIAVSAEGFSLVLSDGQIVAARRVIIATGGLALPKSGSDGTGLAIVERLGHTIVPTTQALTPLMLGRDRTLGGRYADFTGVTFDARIRLRRPGHTKPIHELTGSMLFTHFGLSGPVAMNMSRHWLRERLEKPDAEIEVTIGHPRFANAEMANAWLISCARNFPTRYLSTQVSELFPERFASVMAAPDVELAHLPATKRREVASLIADLRVNVTAGRDYSFAEATAGGVELTEFDYHTMESRKVPGLYLCGEILDVDGRIGGFNFQWAWSSGHAAGRGAVASLNATLDK